MLINKAMVQKFFQKNKKNKISFTTFDTKGCGIESGGGDHSEIIFSGSEIFKTFAISLFSLVEFSLSDSNLVTASSTNLWGPLF